MVPIPVAFATNNQQHDFFVMPFNCGLYWKPLNFTRNSDQLGCVLHLFDVRARNISMNHSKKKKKKWAVFAVLCIFPVTFGIYSFLSFSLLIPNHCDSVCFRVISCRFPYAGQYSANIICWVVDVARVYDVYNSAIKKIESNKWRRSDKKISSTYSICVKWGTFLLVPGNLHGCGCA